MAYTNHRNLIVWQRSMALVKLIYDTTKTFPPYERIGLSSQMQRAAVSIASNIAEGHARESKKDEDYFLQIALGSLCELDTQIEIAFMNGYLNTNEWTNIQKQIEEIQKLLYGFRKSIKKSSNN